MNKRRRVPDISDFLDGHQFRLLYPDVTRVEREEQRALFVDDQPPDNVLVSFLAVKTLDQIASKVMVAASDKELTLILVGVHDELEAVRTHLHTTCDVASTTNLDLEDRIDRTLASLVRRKRRRVRRLLRLIEDSSDPDEPDASAVLAPASRNK